MNIFVLIFPEWGPTKQEITSHLEHPSCFHCGKMDFQSLCTRYAILPPPPHNKIFIMGKNYPPFLAFHCGLAGILPT